MEELRNPGLPVQNIIAILGGNYDDLERVPILGEDEEPENGVFFYEVGYYSYEDSGFYQIYHTHRYSPEDFEKLVIEVALQVIEAKMPEENEHLSRYLDYDPAKDDSGYHRRIAEEAAQGWNFTFSEIYSGIVKVLCANYGFKQIKFSARYSIDGWSRLREEKAAFNAEGDPIYDRISQAIKDKFGTVEDVY